MSQSKKRILFVLPTEDLTAGGERSNFELIKSALNRGYEVHAFVRTEGELEKSLKKLGVVTNILMYNWWNHTESEDPGSTDILATVSIAQYVALNKIDATVTNTLNIPWAAWASSLVNKPHVWIARENVEGEGFSYLQDKCEFVNRFSNVVIANSSELCRELTSGGIKDCKYFMSFTEKPISLGSDSDEIKLVSVGRLEKNKNQLEIIRAMHLLGKRGLRPSVVFIGGSDKDYKLELKREVKKYSLEGQVEFHDFIRDPWSLVSPVDIFIRPSLNESIGRTIVEAMKLGLICVGADIPGTKEAFKLGGGVAYRVGQPGDLADKLEKILSKPSRFRAQALKNAVRAEANLSEQKSHQEFFIQLEKVISDGLGPVNNSVLFKYFKSFARDLNEKTEQNERMKRDIVALHKAIEDKDKLITSSVKKASFMGRVKSRVKRNLSMLTVTLFLCICL